MKTLYIILNVLFFMSAFSQEKKDIIVFGFDTTTDEVIYRVHKGKEEISGFKILINKKKVFFSSSPYLGNEKLTTNTSRKELEMVLKNDNINKQHTFFLFYKGKKYYSVDYLVRKQIN